MRRAVLAIAGTAAVASWLVTLKVPGGEAERPVAATAPEPTGTATTARTVRGRPAATPYGPVTVTVTVAGGRITDVSAVLPSSGESAAVAADAGPKLRQQALAKQSAKLDTVSGATYTSEGYRKSLQSALDQFRSG